MSDHEGAVSYPVMGGTLVFWMYPYRPITVDMLMERLSRVHPQFEYRNSKTGECVHDMPAAYRKALEKARKLNVPSIKTDWTQRAVWGFAEDTFTRLSGITEAIEFLPRALQDADVKAFHRWWDVYLDGDIEAAWNKFPRLVSANMHNLWWEAHNATRDNPAPADVELGQDAPDDPDDPLASSDTAAPTPSSSASSEN